MPTDIRSQIQEHISLGRTEEALALLEQLSSDAVLLQARYNGAKRQYSMGLIDFGEWSRTQAQINYSALEMMNTVRVPSAPIAAPVANPEPAAPVAPQYKVFISYNHEDDHSMRLVADFLKGKGIEVTVDVNEVGVGGNIEAFIEKALKESQYILSIISSHSLKSGWVNKELNAALLLNRFGRKWLPVLLDKKCLEPSFFNETMDEFDENIKHLQEEVSKALAKGRDLRAFTAKLERAKDLQNDFSKTIEALDGHRWVDISGRQLEFGMNQVVQTIKG